MQSQVLSILVENTSGVLSHVSGLFSRRGYNIDSFSSGVTIDPRFTRITVVSHGDEQILEQIEKQLAKLEDVISIKALNPEDSVFRELVLVKVLVSENQRDKVISVANIFRAKIIDVSPDSLIVEVTGGTDKVNALIRLLGDYEILELARTGTTALSRGSQDVTIID